MITSVDKSRTGLFLTFSGNCKEALVFYQKCFGGTLRWETIEINLNGNSHTPVVAGSLFSEKVMIYGSDLVHDGGRKVGNYMAIYLDCETVEERKALIKKLKAGKGNCPDPVGDHQHLIELADAFDVRWVLGSCP